MPPDLEQPQDLTGRERRDDDPHQYQEPPGRDDAGHICGQQGNLDAPGDQPGHGQGVGGKAFRLVPVASVRNAADTAVVKKNSTVLTVPMVSRGALPAR